MQVIWAFQKEIGSLIVSLLVAGILYLLRARVELIWSSPHAWTFLITPGAPPPGQSQASPFTMQTASIFLRNSGKLPATEIELTFNWEPPNLNVWPARPFNTHKSADNRFTVQFSTLAPKEFLQIELLGQGDLPALITVRSKECVGKRVLMVPAIVVNKATLYLRYTLIIFGIASLLYIPVKLISLLM